MAKPFPEAPPAAPGSLAAALAVIPEPRRPTGWRPDHPPLPLVTLLQVCVVAILCGARSLYAIAQWGREQEADDPALLEALGVPAGGHGPCVATLHRVFKVLAVDRFERAVGEWLAQSGVAPDDALALDGKTLRGIHGEAIPGVHLVSAYAHQAAVVIGQLRTDGKGQEIAATKALLNDLPLEGRVVTADALLTQREVCEQIVAGGGDFLFPVKDNQPALEADIARAFSPPASPTVSPILPIWQRRADARRAAVQQRGATLTIVVDAPAKAQHGRDERRIHARRAAVNGRQTVAPRPATLSHRATAHSPDHRRDRDRSDPRHHQPPR